MYEYILSILGIVISGVIAYLFYYYGKKASEKQTETLDLLHEKADGLRDIIEQTTNTKHDYETPSESSIKPTAIDYDKKAEKCLKLLKDPTWIWRSDIILMRKSGLTQSEFDYFVNSTPEIIRSKKPDVYGNKLFTIKSKIVY